MIKGKKEEYKVRKRIRQIYYRGSLDFCNYSCSYCPFSKKRRSRRRLKQDQDELLCFAGKIRMLSESGAFRGAVQIVPYGEALVHTYYWETLAGLSRLDGVEALGAQSNFSFPVEQMLSCFQGCGGDEKKLRLWGTFHPEMTTVEDFAGQCEELQRRGIRFCVGAVGVPENLARIQMLREGLDDSVYLWINKMDGLGRAYTEEEVRAFLAVDEFFGLELRRFAPSREACEGSVFVRGNGDCFPCNLCHGKMGNLYKDGLDGLSSVRCTRGVCDCFLSYGGRSDVAELQAFQPYPMFRIPVRI